MFCFNQDCQKSTYAPNPMITITTQSIYMNGLRQLVGEKLNPSKTQENARKVSNKNQYHIGPSIDHFVDVLESEKLDHPMAYMLVTGDGKQRPKSDKVAVFIASIYQEDGQYTLQDPDQIQEEAVLPMISATEFEYAEQLEDYFDIPFNEI